MPEVFTIYNHGTDFHRDKDATELVTQLSEATQGFEAEIEQTGEPSKENPTPWQLKRPFGVSKDQFPTYLICEGPGSSEVSEEDSHSGVHHAHPGKYNPFIGGSKGSIKKQNPLLKRPLPLTSSKREVRSFQQSFMGNTSKPYQTSGRIWGSGWDDNVIKAVWLLTSFGDELPKTVNILGWSRGAVTCLKMAYKLNEVFPQIKVNIFAVDPVPGGADVLAQGADTYTITPNIENYVAILSLHDHRQNFTPTEVENLVVETKKSSGLIGGHRSKPNIIFLPMPGNHSDLVVEKELGSQYPATAYSKKLSQFMAWKFLTAQGTRFTQDMNMAQNYTARQCCGMYETMLQNLDIIDRMAESKGLVKQKIIGGGFLVREVCANRNRYTPTPFLNLHHWHCHLEAYGQPPFGYRTVNSWPEKHSLQGNLTSLEKAGLCY